MSCDDVAREVFEDRAEINVKAFVEWRIKELLAQGAIYVVVADKDAQTETRYHAAGTADCVFVAIKTDWRYALVREAA
jgi:hypothetical protein